MYLNLHSEVFTGRGLPPPQPVKRHSKSHVRTSRPPKRSNPPGESREQTTYDFDRDSRDYARSDSNIPVPIAEVPNDRSPYSSSKVPTSSKSLSAIVTTSSQTHQNCYNTSCPNDFNNSIWLSRTEQSPLQAPTSETPFNSYAREGSIHSVSASSCGPGIINSAIGCTPPPNAHSSYPSSQPPSQERSQNTSLFRSSTWHNTGNMGAVSGSQWSFENRGRGHMISTRPSKHQMTSQAHSEKYQVANETSVSRSKTESLFIEGFVPSHPARRPASTPDLHGFGMQAKIVQISRKDNAYCPKDNKERLNGSFSAANATTTHSGHRNTADRALLRPASVDEEPNDSVIPTGMDLRRAHQIHKQSRQSNEDFVYEVDVWQGHQKICFINLLFDTGCRDSNWVAAKIVKQLGAETVTRPQRAEFTAFNGQPMTTSEEITLFFKNSKGGSLFWAVFLVADVEAVPFDMVLGGSDCLGFNIIPKPSFPCLGLVPRKLTPEEEKEQREKQTEHALVVEKNRIARRKMEEQKRQAEEGSRKESSQGSNNQERNRLSR